LAELSDADVLRILELIDRSSFDYVQLTLGDLRLTVSKEGPPLEAVADRSAPAQAASAPSVAPALPAATAVPAPVAPAPAPAAAPAPAVPAASATSAASATGGTSASGAGALLPVPSPMVGTFYRAPEPTAPPFVEVGGSVRADSTLGLVEAMKVFTSVLAGVDGTVAEILVENAQFVEYGQTLILIRPSGVPAAG
jgi:acetyl-CoA carboxylase biotin carboxyl carrier protein